MVSENLAVPEIRLENEIEDEEEESKSSYGISYDNAVPEIHTGHADSHKRESHNKNMPDDPDKKSQS